MTQTPTKALPPAKLICRDVWKLFGAHADKTLARLGGKPDAAQLAAAGLVGAVRGVNMEIHDGEIFVIMGLSGSGKSTLVRCLSRLVEPTAGEILYNGQNLLTVSTDALIEIRRRKMGMVFQHFALLPHLSVLDNVAFPLEIQGLPRAERDQRARRMIALVGLEGREASFPRQLSGGQQQRVGIARSLAVEPELWFLDEPFSALDPLIRREMQDELLRLQSVLKKTIVFITHDFDEAIRLADRIAIMKDGEIVQCGTPEEIVLNPATAYVREFTQAVAKPKVVRVTSIMQSGVAEDAATVDARASVAEVAPMFLAGAQAVNVIGADGTVLGSLHRDAVVTLMLGG
ncbi:MAG: betaine/proline/choline family ABC transporter ATP-binding protein [Rhodobacteraceae bacterium]|nr:betaine/proline/choline family ABC transporter ATP-binding protein [Paracoccaceae bacterium]